jgi:hypothetical protein
MIHNQVVAGKSQALTIVADPTNADDDHLGPARLRPTTCDLLARRRRTGLATCD